MKNKKIILMLILSLGSAILGYSYAHEWYGTLESEVEYWGYFSEFLSIALLINIFNSVQGLFMRFILRICLIIQIPPIILWFIFHGSRITDSPPTISDQFVAHWAFSIPHIILLILTLWILKLIKRDKYT